MRTLCKLFVISGVLLCFLAAWDSYGTSAVVHVWEKQELTFVSSNSFQNPYADATVWVDLEGPHFKKRVYGFWDGGHTFKVRLVATEPGTWTWTSGSSPGDAGLSGKRGSFRAIDWSDAAKHENPLRRGFLRPSRNGHALELADGTPFFVIGDTWWAAGTNRFRWHDHDEDKERPIGPQAGFQDYVRYRKSQGYNWINMIAAFPNWMTDGAPWHVVMNDPEKTTVRSAWLEFGTGSAKNMDNEGGRPFLFPGKVPGYENMFPDVDQINPAYFDYVDRKIDYLNSQGFVVFLEVSRRDASLCWKKYYSWPDSYARFIQYIWARYQANNMVLSPIHLDIISETVGPQEYMKAIRLVLQKYGPPPFGTLLSANANPSTLENWGEHSWVTLQQIGNLREHNSYWYLTEIFHTPPPKPAINGEPYYSGYSDVRGLGGKGYKYGAAGGTEQDAQYVRSSMYGSFLSGGLGGYVSGAEGIWGGDIEPAATIKMWDAFQWISGAEVKYLRDFAFSIGDRYRDLEPDSDLVSPEKDYNLRSFEGWAYCARTPDKSVFLAYFEKGMPRAQIRGAKLSATYRAQWFDPQNGRWHDRGEGLLHSGPTGMIDLPDFPEDRDWGLRLILESAADTQD